MKNTCKNTCKPPPRGAAKFLTVSKVWKPAGWRDSFLETGWLRQRARFPTLSSLLYPTPQKVGTLAGPLAARRLQYQ